MEPIQGVDLYFLIKNQTYYLQLILEARNAGDLTGLHRHLKEERPQTSLDI